MPMIVTRSVTPGNLPGDSLPQPQEFNKKKKIEKNLCNCHNFFPAPDWPVKAWQEQDVQQQEPAAYNKSKARRKPADIHHYQGRDIMEKGTEVSIIDVNMPFISMVAFMVKWSLAAIPAMLIMLSAGAFAFAMFGGVIGNML